MWGINGLDEVVANRTQVGTMIANPFLNMTQSEPYQASTVTGGCSIVADRLWFGHAEV